MNALCRSSLRLPCMHEAHSILRHSVQNRLASSTPCILNNTHPGRRASFFLRASRTRSPPLKSYKLESNDSPQLADSSHRGIEFCSVLLSTVALTPVAWAQDSTLIHTTNVVADIADIDAKTAGAIAFVLGPFLSVGILLMIVRIVLSWYPQLDGKKLPWSIAVTPTEPILGPTRQVRSCALECASCVYVSPAFVWY